MEHRTDRSALPTGDGAGDGGYGGGDRGYGGGVAGGSATRGSGDGDDPSNEPRDRGLVDGLLEIAIATVCTVLLWWTMLILGRDGPQAVEASVEHRVTSGSERKRPVTTTNTTARRSNGPANGFPTSNGCLMGAAPVLPVSGIPGYIMYRKEGQCISSGLDNANHIDVPSKVGMQTGGIPSNNQVPHVSDDDGSTEDCHISTIVTSDGRQNTAMNTPPRAHGTSNPAPCYSPSVLNSPSKFNMPTNPPSSNPATDRCSRTSLPTPSNSTNSSPSKLKSPFIQSLTATSPDLHFHRRRLSLDNGVLTLSSCPHSRVDNIPYPGSPATSITVSPSKCVTNDASTSHANLDNARNTAAPPSSRTTADCPDMKVDCCQSESRITPPVIQASPPATDNSESYIDLDDIIELDELEKCESGDDEYEEEEEGEGRGGEFELGEKNRCTDNSELDVILEEEDDDGAICDGCVDLSDAYNYDNGGNGNDDDDVNEIFTTEILKSSPAHLISPLDDVINGITSSLMYDSSSETPARPSEKIPNTPDQLNFPVSVSSSTFRSDNTPTTITPSVLSRRRLDFLENVNDVTQINMQNLTHSSQHVSHDNTITPVTHQSNTINDSFEHDVMHSLDDSPTVHTLSESDSRPISHPSDHYSRKPVERKTPITRSPRNLSGDESSDGEFADESPHEPTSLCNPDVDNWPASALADNTNPVGLIPDTPPFPETPTRLAARTLFTQDISPQNIELSSCISPLNEITNIPVVIPSANLSVTLQPRHSNPPNHGDETVTNLPCPAPSDPSTSITPCVEPRVELQVDTRKYVSIRSPLPTQHSHITNSPPSTSPPFHTHHSSSLEPPAVKSIHHTVTPPRENFSIRFRLLNDDDDDALPSEQKQPSPSDPTSINPTPPCHEVSLVNSKPSPGTLNFVSRDIDAGRLYGSDDLLYGSTSASTTSSLESLLAGNLSFLEDHSDSEYENSLKEPTLKELTLKEPTLEHPTLNTNYIESIDPDSSNSLNPLTIDVITHPVHLDQTNSRNIDSSQESQTMSELMATSLYPHCESTLQRDPSLTPPPLPLSAPPLKSTPPRTTETSPEIWSERGLADGSSDCKSFQVVGEWLEQDAVGAGDGSEKLRYLNMDSCTSGTQHLQGHSIENKSNNQVVNRCPHVRKGILKNRTASVDKLTHANMTPTGMKPKRYTSFTKPFNDIQCDIRHISPTGDSHVEKVSREASCSFSSDDLAVCRWQDSSPATTYSQIDGRAVVTETDLDTGVRRSLDLLRETDLDRAVSMLSLHVTTSSPSPAIPGTRRSYSHLPTTELSPSLDGRQLNAAISASELRFIEARERLTPPTWWTRRGTSDAVTPARMKNLERLSRSQVSLGSTGHYQSPQSPHTPQLSPRIVYPDTSPCSPQLVPRQNRQRAASATPRLTSLSANCSNSSFSLPSEEYRQKASPWKKMPTHARRKEMPLSPEIARRLGNSPCETTPLSPEIAQRVCVSPLQTTPLFTDDTPSRLANTPLQTTPSAKQAYLNLKNQQQLRRNALEEQKQSNSNGHILSSPRSPTPLSCRAEVPSTPPLDYVIRGLLSLSPESPVPTPRTSRGDGNCASAIDTPTLVDTPSLETPPTDEESLTYISCGNQHCSSTAPLHEARRTYKTCRNCYAYYCQRSCRQFDWTRHKRSCLFSRVRSACSAVLRHVHSDIETTAKVTRAAKRGFLNKGRGCVAFRFSSLEAAESFKRNEFVQPEPYYNTVDELRSVEDETLRDTVKLCTTYNPQVKCVVHVAVRLTVEGENEPDVIVRKAVCIRLVTWATSGQQGDSCGQGVVAAGLVDAAPGQGGVAPDEGGGAMVITARPRLELEDNLTGERARHLCFLAALTRLGRRGVRLRRDYPAVYAKLAGYAANGRHFSPVTLFPRDAGTGRTFVCLVTTDAEPGMEQLAAGDNCIVPATGN